MLHLFSPGGKGALMRAGGGNMSAKVNLSGLRWPLLTHRLPSAGAMLGWATSQHSPTGLQLNAWLSFPHSFNHWTGYGLIKDHKNTYITLIHMK